MKKRSLSAVCLVFLCSLLSVAVVRDWTERRAQPAENDDHAISAENTVRRFVLYVILPLWVASEFLDYLCHRQTKIEKTAGPFESALHNVLAAQIALPVLNALFLRTNVLALLLMIASLVAHTVTGIVDVAYAEERRKVTQVEQHVHSALEMIPLMTTAVTMCMHPEQVRKLVRADWEPGDLTLRAKRRPLPPRVVAGIVAAIAGFVLLPYAEELWRCVRTMRSQAPQSQG